MSAALADDALWGVLPVPALLLDAHDTVTRLNPAAEGFFNVSSRAAGGMRLGDMLSVDMPLGPALARARAADAPLFVSDVDVTVAGQARAHCSMSIAPLAGQPGDMLMLITPRDMAGQMAQGAQTRSAARTAIGMAEMLAHEIKNPLAGITGAAQLLSMTLDSADRELTDLIVSESRRIVSLLEQVESFGNLRAPDLRAVNIHDVLSRARRSAQLGFAADMAIVEDYDPSLPDAWGDPDMLLQVLQNLLKNAAEAAPPEGGTIRLRSHYDHAMRRRGPDGTGTRLPLQIEVIDDGPGIPPALLDDLFEPFVSGRENGTGLGLALAARIMAGHGGAISLTSAPGRCVFRLSLPLAAPGGGAR